MQIKYLAPAKDYQNIIDEILQNFWNGEAEDFEVFNFYLVVKKGKLWDFRKFSFYPYPPGPVRSLFLIYKSKQLLATHRTMLPRRASRGAATII